MRKPDGNLVLLVMLIVILLITGGIMSGGTYLSLFNIQSMGSQVPEIGFLAIGVMLAMCAGDGGIDLSGIAMANMAGVASGLFAMSIFPVAEAPILFTVTFAVGCMVVGLIGGALNGLIISRLGITPILCTLGTQMLFTGITVVLSSGRAVRIGSPEPLYEIGNGYFYDIPISFLMFIAVALVLGVVLRYTPYGVKLMMTGANPKAAEFSGFSRFRIVTVTYALSGLLAGLAGLIIAARNVNVKWDYGTTYLLIAILVAVMAGVKPDGGHGRVINVVLSAIILQLLSSLLNFIGLSNFVRDLAWGALLLCFLFVNRLALVDYFNTLLSSRRDPHASKT
ncbi:ABC transporter permease [Cohaesibacter celericrescens]|jgi:simple sugar transport system permease protein|uniref:Sugar ABC transporter permease n=1 Tax=Cohaesibacter celericrescens TaxID=2067669 RepID=A0A2N5XK02_9HYPH|nr:ABC transporter permease [Cohaesibacter celericrescens]PLW74843.1 sugar ABC transporter permease [Cohaesibacter celericrescens]